MRLVVTLDVEADNQWDFGVPITTRNVRSLEPFQEICERHGVLPTYLLASEIVESDDARELLAGWHESGHAEIGAHLHPWTTPPYTPKPGLRYNDHLHAFPSELPSELLRDKVARLSAQISAAFGRPPTAFRAGRYGLDSRLAQILAEAGYVVDSSVTPLTSWRDTPGMSRGGPDFSRIPATPFRIAGSGQPGLVEIPVTVMQTYPIFEKLPFLLRAYKTLPVRAVRKMFLSAYLQPQPMWLVPYPHYAPKDLALVWRRAEEAGLDVAVMKFHSSELMPGGSPYRPTADSVRDLLACLDGFFRFVRASGGGFAGLTEAALETSGASQLEVRAL